MSNMTKRQKEMALIVLASLFLVVLTAYSYFLVYAPSKEALKQTEQSLTSEREVIMALETQLKEVPEGERISVSELQQKVSIEPLTELIVLQVEQAELLSNSMVSSITFTEGPLELLQSVEGVENVQEVLTSVTLETPDYQSLTAFIREIEAMQRIMIIDSINFAATPEVTQQAQVEESLALTVTFSAFYRPDLIALADTKPKVDTPTPAGKNNPLPQNDGVDLASPEQPTEETTVSEEDVEVDVDVTIQDDTASVNRKSENPNVAGAQTVQYHKVKKGETLFSIAIRYFNTREGEAWIKKANQLDGETVLAGTTLTIPERP